MLPFAGLIACSSEEKAPTIAANTDDAPASRPEPAASSSGSAAREVSSQGEQLAQNDAGGNDDLEKLSEDNSQAKALNYKHEASEIDKDKNPRYEEGQLCSNCQLYSGADGDDWGPCGIFPGKVVKASGWCSSYAPKRG